MSKHSDKPRDAASNSFTSAELRAVAQLFKLARTVGLLSVLMRSAPMVNFERKVLRMIASIEGRPTNGALTTQKDGPSRARPSGT